jgi:fructose-1-phosphate kinase PfkB-like protein
MLKLKETNNKLQSKLSNIQLKVSYIIETKLRTNITLQHKEGPKGTKLN